MLLIGCSVRHEQTEIEADRLGVCMHILLCKPIQNMYVPLVLVAVTKGGYNDAHSDVKHCQAIQASKPTSCQAGTPLPAQVV